MKWETEFDQRQQREIEFSRLYAEDFHHGTDGHNAKMIIAKMAELLDQYEKRIEELDGQLDEIAANQ